VCSGSPWRFANEATSVPVGGTRIREDVTQVVRHGVEADEEGVGYLLVGLADSEQPKDTSLALRQPRWQSRVQSLRAAKSGHVPATQLGGIAWKPVVSDDGRPLEPIGAWPTVRRDLDHRLVDVQWTV
jgi:hypothetical protein